MSCCAASDLTGSEAWMPQVITTRSKIAANLFMLLTINESVRNHIAAFYHEFTLYFILQRGFAFELVTPQIIYLVNLGIEQGGQFADLVVG